MAQPGSGRVVVWRVLVLIGATGTAVGLIGKVPWLGLVAGPLSMIGVVGLLMAQRASARSAPVEARDRHPGRHGSEGSQGRPGPARPGPARRWVWVAAVVAAAAGAAVLLAHPWRDDQSVRPVAARVPLSFSMVRDVVPGPCGSDPPSPAATASAGASPSALEFPAADGRGCVTVSADGGFAVRQLEQVRVRDETDQGNGWTVAVTLAGQDATRFIDLTGRLSALPEPRNQLAVVLGSRTLSVPTVMEPLTTGTAVIATRLTRAEAEALASELGAR